MGIFPGKRLKIEDSNIYSKIMKLINPQEIQPIENMKNWVQVDNDLYDLEFLEKYNKFYYLYEHPVHDFLDRLYEVDKVHLINFLKERIDPVRGEGMDLFICPYDFSDIIICNHDGKVYKAVHYSGS